MLFPKISPDDLIDLVSDYHARTKWDTTRIVDGKILEESSEQGFDSTILYYKEVKPPSSLAVMDQRD